MPLTDKELGDALQTIAEQLHAIDQHLAKIAHSLTALKAVVSMQMSPDQPLQALKQIEEWEEKIAKLDPNASARQQAADIFEAVKLMGKHGGPKKA